MDGSSSMCTQQIVNNLYMIDEVVLISSVATVMPCITRTEARAMRLYLASYFKTVGTLGVNTKVILFIARNNGNFLTFD